MKRTGLDGPIEKVDGRRPGRATAQEVSPHVFGIGKRFVAIGAAAILAVTALGTAAFAATGGPTPTPGTTTAVAPAASTPGASSTATPRTNYAQVFIQKLASALGIDQATLVAGIKKAEIDTINQAVANGDLARNQADTLIQQIQQSNSVLPLGGLFGGHGRGNGVGPGVGARTPIVDQNAVISAVAGKLGLSVTDLQSQLTSGQTLASLAKAHNLQVQDLYDAAAAAAKPSLDAAVKAGTITQAQADQITQQLQSGQYVLRGARGNPGASSGNPGPATGGPGPAGVGPMGGGPGPRGRGVGGFGGFGR